MSLSLSDLETAVQEHVTSAPVWEEVSWMFQSQVGRGNWAAVAEEIHETCELEPLAILSDDRGRQVFTYLGGRGSFGAVVVVAPGLTRVLDVILVDSDRDLLTDMETLHDSTHDWEAERNGPRPEGWDNPTRFDHFYFAVTEEGVVLARKTLWEEHQATSVNLEETVFDNLGLARVGEAYFTSETDKQTTRATLMREGFQENEDLLESGA